MPTSNASSPVKPSASALQAWRDAARQGLKAKNPPASEEEIQRVAKTLERLESTAKNVPADASAASPTAAAKAFDNALRALA